MQNIYSNDSESYAAGSSASRNSSTARKRVGRPPKVAGAALEAISLSLPQDDIERLRVEAPVLGADSISAVVRTAVREFLNRLDKRRARDLEN